MPIRITDVTLRDGLQMEARVLPTTEKLELLEKVAACGYDRFEITSFVNPKWGPQFADAETFCREADKRGLHKAEWMAFVPNEKGFERMLSTSIEWAGTFVAASETFNRKNVNHDVQESLEILKTVIQRGKKAGRKVRAYISTAFGCPYEGNIPTEKLIALFTKVAALSPDEIALSDTIGVAVPAQVTSAVESAKKIYPVEKIALHLHNTYGLATASALAGLSAGVTIFDGSTGGTGGCPYAKGATGNFATEDLLYALFRAGAVPAPGLLPIKEVYKTLKAAGVRVTSRLHEILEKGGSLYGL